jgi:hypothetical protein
MNQYKLNNNMGNIIKTTSNINDPLINPLDEYLNNNSTILPCFKYYSYDPLNDRKDTEYHISWTIGTKFKKNNIWGGELSKIIVYNKETKIFSFEITLNEFNEKKNICTSGYIVETYERDFCSFCSIDTWDYRYVLVMLLDVDEKTL